MALSAKDLLLRLNRLHDISRKRFKDDGQEYIEIVFAPGDSPAIMVHYTLLLEGGYHGALYASRIINFGVLVHTSDSMFDAHIETVLSELKRDAK